jgi:hypothetical protein
LIPSFPITTAPAAYRRALFSNRFAKGSPFGGAGKAVRL